MPMSFHDWAVIEAKIAEMEQAIAGLRELRKNCPSLPDSSVRAIDEAIAKSEALAVHLKGVVD